MDDAILNQNMTQLINFKLTPNTFIGAEGYHNKFNGSINALQQQGHGLPLPLLKSVYLENIQDKTYQHIKHHACTMWKLLPFKKFNHPYRESIYQ